ncbi:MAG: hypothetical protein IJZ34_11420 [Lachnospiraceae bacterium]|nr:hypothetical protein [Lachnospiraceae bacterium]
MNKQCSMSEVESVIEEMELSEISEDVAELEEGYQLVLSGWYVRIPKLHLRLHEGVVGYGDEEMKEYMPDFCVTVIYPEEPAETEYLYYEQDGMFTTMVNWLHGQMSMEEIEHLECEILIPQESSI